MITAPIQIQTGRLYTDKGQRIIAALWPEDQPTAIIFRDGDRMIDGAIPLVRPPQDRFQMRDMVMFNYDHTQYHHLSVEQRDFIRALDWNDSNPTMNL